MTSAFMVRTGQDASAEPTPAEHGFLTSVLEDYRPDEAPGVEFLGTDAAGKTTFSKAASNWRTPASVVWRAATS